VTDLPAAPRFYETVLRPLASAPARAAAEAVTFGTRDAARRQRAATSSSITPALATVSATSANRMISAGRNTPMVIAGPSLDFKT
jgi:hypothetical protein